MGAFEEFLAGYGEGRRATNGLTNRDRYGESDAPPASVAPDIQNMRSAYRALPPAQASAFHGGMLRGEAAAQTEQSQRINRVRYYNHLQQRLQSGQAISPDDAKWLQQVQAQRNTQATAARLGIAPQQLQVITGPVSGTSERDAYADLDKQRAAQAGAAMVRDAVNHRNYVARHSDPRVMYNTLGTPGPSLADDFARVKRLGSKETWTKDDLVGLSDKDLAHARALRNHNIAETGVANPAPPGPGPFLPDDSLPMYEYQPDNKERPYVAHMYSPNLPYGTTAPYGLSEVRGMQMGDLRYQGPDNSGVIDIHHDPVKLNAQLQNKSAPEAAKTIADRIRRQQLAAMYGGSPDDYATF